jgi:sporulation related protein
VRVAFFVLLAVNLVYLAWAGWIDAPALAPVATQSKATLSELALATDQVARPDQPDLAGAPADSSGTRTASVGGASQLAATTAANRCVSVGPFNDLARAARGAALLRDRGLNPRQRAEPGETWNGYWVYVGGLKTDKDLAKVMKALAQAGLTDAAPMPETSEGRRVSVGLFSDKDRAEKRAAAITKLGLSADLVERKQPGTVYWVDMDLGANDRSVSTEGLLSADDPGGRLEIRVCPGSTPPTTEPASTPSRPGPTPRDARPAATTADAGTPRPG